MTRRLASIAAGTAFGVWSVWNPGLLIWATVIAAIAWLLFRWMPEDGAS